MQMLRFIDQAYTVFTVLKSYACAATVRHSLGWTALDAITLRYISGLGYAYRGQVLDCSWFSGVDDLAK
jgi:hypothetical protein